MPRQLSSSTTFSEGAEPPNPKSFTLSSKLTHLRPDLNTCFSKRSCTFLYHLKTTCPAHLILIQDYNYIKFVMYLVQFVIFFSSPLPPCPSPVYVLHILYLNTLFLKLKIIVSIDYKLIKT